VLVLDFRFGWSRNWLEPVPLAVVLAAQALAVAGYWFVFWVFISLTVPPLPSFSERDALLVPILIYRLIHEERTLRRDLEGYGDYCARYTSVDSACVVVAGSRDRSKV
jgi:protein-S-isoprenylcysteine O-methyltransferase Ste14